MDNVLKGKLGFKGERGFSAYEIAVQNGFVGTEKDWLAQLGTSTKFERNSVIYEATEEQTEFDIPEGYTSNSFLDVYVDGEHLDSTEYTLNTETMKFTLANAITVAGTKVEVIVVTMSTNELPIVENLTDSSTNETVLGAKSLYELLPVDVKSFGAKGDGTTDDTEAIQKAINTGRNVYLPSGTYKVTSSITISNSCILSGDGETTVIRSEADITLITTKANTTIENLKLVGNDTNTAISVFQTKQILRNISFEHFAIGCINKNSDYIGTVKFVDLSFNYVSTCFQSTTLTNGVTFERIVAYRFDRILRAYWIEGAGFNNCFFEIGNEGSIVLDIPEGKTNCRCMGLSFYSCYVENVTQLLSTVVTGVIKFDSCWLYTKETFYNNAEGTNNLKLLFTNCAFSISSTLSTSSTLFNFSDTHTVVFENSYGLKTGSGSFNMTKGTNIVGGSVIIDFQFIKHTTITATTDENGIIKTGKLTTKHRILCVYGFRTDGLSNMYAIPYMSGDNWYVTCRNPLSDGILENKEVQLRITYIDSSFLETE